MKNRVIIITTKGCEACSFMQRIVAKAYSEAKIEDTSIGVYDFHDREVEDLVQKENITDFPTTLLIQNGVTIYKVVGTQTKDDILKEIKKFEDNPVVR